MSRRWPELCDFLRIYIADGPGPFVDDEKMPQINGHEVGARTFVREEPDELSAAAVVQAREVLDGAGTTLHEDFRDIANLRFDSDARFRSWLGYVLAVLEHERERVANPVSVEVGSPGWIEAIVNDYVRSYQINPPPPGPIAWASSFPDHTVAEDACTQAIEQHDDRVSAWLESGRGQRLVVEARCAGPIGYGLSSPEGPKWDSRTVRVVIARRPEGKWIVENAYPIPDFH